LKALTGLPLKYAEKFLTAEKYFHITYTTSFKHSEMTKECSKPLGSIKLIC